MLSPQSRKNSVPRLAILLVGFALPSLAEKVIIETQTPDATAQQVQRLGGKVSRRFKYLKAIAADVPTNGIAVLRTQLGKNAITKDAVVRRPTDPKGKASGRLDAAAVIANSRTASTAELKSLAVKPDSYLITNATTRVDTLHADGFLGTGVRVAIIDSGLRPGFPHITGSVLGGEDFVGDGNGFSDSTNDGHGTFVNGIITAHAVFGFAKNSALPTAILTHCPSCISDQSQTLVTIPMIGTAPDARTYHLRALGVDGTGSTSGIIAAMERAIELRENFNKTQVETPGPNGSYQSLNLKVVNMSLGGTTNFAGGELTDKLTQLMLEKDIVITISAGNSGPSGSTIGSPGTGIGALTVGAASSPVNERILRDLQFGAGTGVKYRPFNAYQMAYFSSRGPTADGRQDPELVANGEANFGMGFGGTSTVNIASGTSFSSPAIAGIAAVLRQAFPDSTAKEIRNSLILGANPYLLADGSGVNDQGAGFVDAAFARQLLFYGIVPQTGGNPSLGYQQVARNVLEAGAVVVSGDVTQNTGPLLPGQRFELYYPVTINDSLVVTVSNLVKGNPQNVLFGDDLLVSIHDSITGEDAPVDFFGGASRTYTLAAPEPGLVRVTISGDWTNASSISALVNIHTTPRTLPLISKQGTILAGQQIFIPFSVPAGKTSLKAQLEWTQDWGRYATNDIDLYLVRPNSTIISSGATLSSPEAVSITNPPAGNWLAIIDGFSLPLFDPDNYTLRVTLDGTTVPLP